MLRSKSEAGRGGRFAVGSAIVMTLVVAATGCSSAGGSRGATAAASSAAGSPSSSDAPITTASTTTSAPAAPIAPIAPTTSAPPSTSAPVAQNTGSYLQTLLPSINGFAASVGLGGQLPSGWKANGGELDSGPAATAPAPSIVGDGACGYLTGKNNRLDLAGGLSVATASEYLGNGTTAVDVAFYAYAPGDAAKSLAQVRQNATSTCDGFRMMSLGGNVDVKVSATPVSGIGDEALLVVTTPQGAYVSEENLLVRRGNLMLSLSSNDVYGALPDLTPAAKTLVAEMG